MSRRKRRTPHDPLLGRILASGAAPVGEAGRRILDAAIRQFEDFGVRRFTIDDVARRAGVSRVTVYRYFPKKDDLIEAVLMHELRRFLREIDAAVAPYDALDDRLVEGFVFALTFLRDHSVLNRLLRTEPELILPTLTVNAAPILGASREFISGYARREAERGGLPLSDEDIDGVSELLARSVISFVLTPGSVLGLRTSAEIRRFAERYLAPTLHALAAQPSAAALTDAG
jgi:AcrR family transcriptional regulator